MDDFTRACDFFSARGYFVVAPTVGPPDQMSVMHPIEIRGPAEATDYSHLAVTSPGPLTVFHLFRDAEGWIATGGGLPDVRFAALADAANAILAQLQSDAVAIQK